jgi:hypothetical protein
MTTTAPTMTPPGDSTALPRARGSLFRAELHRLVALAVLGWLFAVVIGLLNYAHPTAADRAAARQTMQQMIAQNEAGRQQCLNDPPAEGPGKTPEEICGPPLTAANLNADDFLGKHPFDFATTGTAGAIGFTAASSVLAFIVGATWIGAEWSSRSLVALLFWVPRRLQVMGTKLAVLALAAAGIGVVAQAAWLGMAGILRAAAGSDNGLPEHFWGDLLATQARGVLLTVLVALIGFGLTNLIRNTGAALGVGFVYFAVVETALRMLRPGWQPWLLSNNVAGLLSPHGITVYIDEGLVPTDMGGQHSYLITNLQAGLVLTAIAAVIVGAGVLLFTRRDLH